MLRLYSCNDLNTKWYQFLPLLQLKELKREGNQFGIPPFDHLLYCWQAIGVTMVTPGEQKQDMTWMPQDASMETCTLGMIFRIHKKSESHASLNARQQPLAMDLMFQI